MENVTIGQYDANKGKFQVWHDHGFKFMTISEIAAMHLEADTESRN